jgi:hypothetical protein
MRRGFLAACLLGALCSIGHAACDTGLAERMHEKLHPTRALDHELAVCEPWRGLPGRYIVVLPMPLPSTEPDDTKFDLDVLVVQQADNGNTDHARVVSRLFEESALSEGTVHILEIRVDPARFALAPEARAFGLHILRQGSSRTSPFSNDTLSLYVPQGAKLAKVLDKLELTREGGELADDDCTGDFETVRGSLSVARSVSNGWADLMLHQSHSDSRSLLQGEECVTQEQPGSFKSRLLRFDGKEYRAAKGAAAD